MPNKQTESVQYDFFESFFNDFTSEKSFIETKVCKRCGIEKSVSAFRQRQRTEDGKSKRYNITCRQCERETGKILSALKKSPLTPPQPEKCDCCGKKTKKLNLDHCHETDTFRGWICTRCNTGISRLNDTIQGVQRAFLYLKAHKDKLENNDEIAS